MDFIIDNWSELALATLLLLDTIVSLTPSKKDDQILGYIKAVFTALTKKSDNTNEEADTGESDS
jgi:hypothetical protein